MLTSGYFVLYFTQKTTKMNPIIKEKILKLIDTNAVIKIESQHSDSFRIINKRGECIIRIESAHAYNSYYIVSGDDRTMIARTTWHKTDVHVTRFQQDIMDIIAICRKKAKSIDERNEIYNKMTDEEKKINEFLNSWLVNTL